VSERIGWTSADTGVLPSAYDDPWTVVGAALTIADDEYVVLDANPAAELSRWRPLHPHDGPSTLPRSTEYVWAQAKLRVASADAWAPQSVASVCGFALSDGNRILGVSVGNGNVWLIDPQPGIASTGVVLYDVGSFATTLSLDIMLVKHGAERWELIVNGKSVASIPYLLAPPDTAPLSPGGSFRWGSLSPGHVSTSYWAWFEDSLNIALPVQARLTRNRLSLPIALQARWNALSEAFHRATNGLFAHANHLLDGAATQLEVGRLPAVPKFTFLGDEDPTLLDPVWLKLTPANVTTDRERQLLDGITSAIVGLRATFPQFLANAVHIPVDSDMEWRVGATWRVDEYTPDAHGRVGPYVQMHNGDRIVTAQLVEIDSATPDLGRAWRLTDSAIVGALTLATKALSETDDTAWRVNVERAHSVELQVLGHDVVLLIVDGRIVDHTDYGAFADVTAAEAATIACNGDGVTAGADTTAYVWDGFAELRCADLTSRDLWRQNALDRTIWIGGCERNDVVDTAKNTTPGVIQGRGTLVGLSVELRRLTCDARSVGTVEHVPGEWFLEVSYPEVTPIYLEVDGNVATTMAEVFAVPPNFTVDTFGAMIARYLLPMSTLGMRYAVALAVETTAPITNPVPTTSQLTVDSTDWFAIGDLVDVRNAAGTLVETRTVLAVPSGILIQIGHIVSADFPAGSVMRKIIAST